MKKASGNIDHIFLALIMGLVIFGIVILTSASSPSGYEEHTDSYFFIKHQILSGVLPGVLAMITTSMIPFVWYKKIAFQMLIVSVVLLALVFIPGIGEDFGTFANSWVKLGTFSFQPTEIVKLTFLIYLSAWMAKRNSGQMQDFKEGMIPFLVVVGLVALLILMQPDTGTLSIIAATAFVVYFIAGGSLKHMTAMCIAGLACFWILIKSSPYRTERFMTFLHPELDPQGVGYQINQALLAIGSGGWFGKGYGHSVQKFQYLPEVIGDSIFAVMAEELGFFLSMLFVAVFVIMILRGLEIARKVPDRFGSYLIIGIVVWFGAQAFVNIGAMVGILPITGVPLPFLSYGGTALVMCMAASGIVLNISKYAK